VYTTLYEGHVHVFFHNESNVKSRLVWDYYSNVHLNWTRSAQPIASIIYTHNSIFIKKKLFLEYQQSKGEFVRAFGAHPRMYSLVLVTRLQDSSIDREEVVGPAAAHVVPSTSTSTIRSWTANRATTSLRSTEGLCILVTKTWLYISNHIIHKETRVRSESSDEFPFNCWCSKNNCFYDDFSTKERIFTRWYSHLSRSEQVSV